MKALCKFFAGSYVCGFFQWFYTSGDNCGFTRITTFPTLVLKAYANRFYINFSATYVGAGMICPFIVNISLLIGAILSWGVIWPLIDNEKDSRYSVSLPSSSFHGFQGYRAKAPVKTLDELHVCEVVPSLYFPSCLERRETKPVNGLLVFFDSKELESSSEISSASQIRTENIHEFGQKTKAPLLCNNSKSSIFPVSGKRPRHHYYVITARAQSFLYHQVTWEKGVG